MKLAAAAAQRIGAGRISACLGMRKLPLEPTSGGSLHVLLERIAELTDVRSIRTMILLATKFERPDVRMRPFRWAPCPLSSVHASEWGAK